MAVYERSYRRYEGPVYSGARLSLALARYTYEDMRRSRLLTPVLYSGFLLPLFFLLAIYLNGNAEVLQLIGLRRNLLISVDAGFFYTFLGIQSFIAFVVAALAGPGLIAPDLANRALSSILARPISRTGYVLGRMLPLAGMLSVITWIPGLLLVAAQVGLGEDGWLAGHWRFPFAVFLGSLLWVGVLSLMAMALSAWVRWKPVAGGLMFVIFFILPGLGALFNAMLDVRWGHLVNMPVLMTTVWVWLMEGGTLRDSGFGPFAVSRNEELPVWLAFLAITLFCLACVRLLATRIRGAEVVR